jgi:sugar/nucleoside kinase (ribokinase family)
VPRYDYTAVGHVTADLLADGSRRAGGGALYSALQAARLGQRTLVITRGVTAEMEELFAPYAGELELDVRPAPQTTTFENLGSGLARKQRVLAWAGPIEPPVDADTAILHFAPVARETPALWRGDAEFVGVTAQGLVRTWGEPGGVVDQVPLAAEQLPERCDAIAIGKAERDSCAWLIAAVEGSDRSGTPPADQSGADARFTRTLLAITAEAEPTSLHVPGSSPLALEVPPVESVVDDLGAGDVFAAAFFIALREGRSPREAAAFGNAAAAVRISGEGPQAVGRRDAIEARLGAIA